MADKEHNKFESDLKGSPSRSKRPTSGMPSFTQLESDARQPRYWQWNVRPLELGCLVTAALFAACAASLCSFNFSSISLAGVASFVAFMLWVAAPYLVTYMAAKSVSNRASRTLLAIGLLCLIAIGLAFLSRDNGPDDWGIGLLVVPGVQLVGSLILLPIAKVIDQVFSP